MQTAVYRQAEKMRQALYSIPALKYLMPHGEVETKMISWPLVNQNKARAFIFEKKVGAAVFMTRRAVPNDWEKVSLRVMLDAAQDAGGIFGDIDPQNPDTALPAELLSLCDKAIAQGRAVRRDAGGLHGGGDANHRALPALFGELEHRLGPEPVGESILG
jgi:hypothetical protein